VIESVVDQLANRGSKIETLTSGTDGVMLQLTLPAKSVTFEHNTVLLLSITDMLNPETVI